MFDMLMFGISNLFAGRPSPLQGSCLNINAIPQGYIVLHHSA